LEFTSPAVSRCAADLTMNADVTITYFVRFFFKRGSSEHGDTSIGARG